MPALKLFKRKKAFESNEDAEDVCDPVYEQIASTEGPHSCEYCKHVSRFYHLPSTYARCALSLSLWIAAYDGNNLTFRKWTVCEGYDPIKTCARCIHYVEGLWTWNLADGAAKAIANIPKCGQYVVDPLKNHANSSAERCMNYKPKEESE